MASKSAPEESSSRRETLLEFPCRFPIKAMGLNDGGLGAVVEKIILVHADIFAGEPVVSKPSAAGKYLSVTVTIEARSQAQLDRIYQDLTDCESVLIAL